MGYTFFYLKQKTANAIFAMGSTSINGGYSGLNIYV